MGQGGPVQQRRRRGRELAEAGVGSFDQGQHQQPGQRRQPHARPQEGHGQRVCRSQAAADLALPLGGGQVKRTSIAVDTCRIDLAGGLLPVGAGPAASDHGGRFDDDLRTGLPGRLAELQRGIVGGQRGIEAAQVAEQRGMDEHPVGGDSCDLVAAVVLPLVQLARLIERDDLPRARPVESGVDQPAAARGIRGDLRPDDLDPPVGLLILDGEEPVLQTLQGVRGGDGPGGQDPQPLVPGGEAVRELALQGPPELGAPGPGRSGRGGLLGPAAVAQQLRTQRTGEVLGPGIGLRGQFDDDVGLPRLGGQGGTGRLRLFLLRRRNAAAEQDDSGDMGRGRGGDQTARFRSLRRSRSERPPQMPNRSSLASA